MSNQEAALVIARAAVPYYEEQHRRGDNWYTQARLEDAKRALQTIERLAP